MRVRQIGLLLLLSFPGGAATQGPRPRGQAARAPRPALPKALDVRDSRFGARGDGIADDTVSIQEAVDEAADTGATVRIPKGIYLVNALVSIRLRSRMTLAMEPGAVLKALPNGSAHYAIILISGAEDVTVSGGTLQGERAEHTGRDGEWGHGLALAHARHVSVEGVTTRDCWGDGFYVASSSAVAFRRVTADHNRRQGMSVTSVSGLTVQDSVFKNTGGTLPEDGLDVEPNRGDTAEDILISGCRFEDNGGHGLQIGVPQAHGGRAWISRATVEGNTITGSGKGSIEGSAQAGLEISNTGGHQIRRNTISGNGSGILLRNGADRLTITGNTITGNAGDGIVQYLCTGNAITGNTVSRNAGRAIYSPQSSGGQTAPNQIEGNGPAR